MKMKFYTFLSLLFVAGLMAANNPATAGNNDPKVVTNNLAAELATAAQNGTNTIVVITDNNGNGTGDALKLANETASLSPNTMVAVLNRDLEENAALLSKYQLVRFPAPYVVILSPAGYIAGGVVPGRITAERLAKYVPSHCYNSVLNARSQQKAVYALVYTQQDDTYNQWMESLKATQAALDPAPEILPVDAADQNEQGFLARIGYTPTEGPAVIVLNAAGQIVGNFTDQPTKDDLVKATSKVVNHSCSGCPSSRSCSPKEKAGCGSK